MIFKQYETITSFGESIFSRKAKTVECEEDQSNILKHMV